MDCTSLLIEEQIAMTPYAPEIERQMQGFYSSLNERDRRRYAGIESLKLGWGVVSQKLPNERNEITSYITNDKSSVAVYIPSVFRLVGINQISTGMKIFKKPVSLVSNKGRYRLFRLGMTQPGTRKNNPNPKMQFFRMDFGRYEHEKDKGMNWDVWQSQDQRVHFHVPKPGEAGGD